MSAVPIDSIRGRPHVERVKKQLSLFSRAQLGDIHSAEHGGDIRRGRRKIARPLSSRRPIHVVLRSERARGIWSLRHRSVEAKIKKTLKAQAARHGIKIYSFANAVTHLHLLVRAPRRDQFHAFLRGFAGTATRIVTGARRGRPIGRFWSTRAYSRIVH